MACIQKDWNQNTTVKILKVKITFNEDVEPLVLSSLKRIDKLYPIVHLLDVDAKQPIPENSKMIFKKRNQYYLHPIRSSNQHNRYDIWLHYRTKSNVQALDTPTNSNSSLSVDREDIELETNSQKEVVKATIAKLKLDFQWIGTCSRIGATVEQFAKEVQARESFLTVKINHLSHFLEQLDNKLTQHAKNQTQPAYTDSLLKQCYAQTEDILNEIEKQVEQIICDKFNERVVIIGISYHRYLHLLKSRNYFRLFYVEEPVKLRFENFKRKAKQTYCSLYNWLTLENFIELDQFWYASSIQKTLKEVSFTLNRLSKPLPSYSTIIESSPFVINSVNRNSIFQEFRPNFDSYFISICKVLKERGGCIKQAAGAIIVKNKRIIATGYNGTPMGAANCYHGGCQVCNNSGKMSTEVLSCNCIHAEYGCIIEAGIHITKGCTLYTTQLPCLWCTKMIVQAKIECVVYLQAISDSLRYENEKKVIQMFKEAQVDLIKVPSHQTFFSKP